MGIYLNPKNETKEEYLNREAILFPYNIAKAMGFDAIVQMGRIPAIWVDNEEFTACGIAYCNNEFNIFMSPEDPRPRKIYLIPIDVIEKEVPDIKELLEKYKDM